MQINDPEVVAELTAQHVLYEKASMENESAFWESPLAIRYGEEENLARTVQRLEVLTLGSDMGVINLEFARVLDGIERQGRQSQVWARLPEGWRIVSGWRL